MVTPQYISMIEKGEKTPTDAMVQRIAHLLDFPPEFFYGVRIELVGPEAVSFRARRSMTSSIRDIGLGTADIAVGVVTPDLEHRFTLPTPDLPDLSAHTPQEAAAILRTRWGLGFEPIQNMVHLLESRGVLVYWLHADSRHLDAISLWRDRRPFVFLNTYKSAGDRGRFDAAHELGHLVLHQLTSDLTEKQTEDQADSFASAFLLPAEAFQMECPERPDFAALYRLKAKWKVSVAAMIMRGAELGIFTDWQKRQAFQTLNATGARVHERTPIQREQSKLHRMIFDALAKKGISPTGYAATLGLNEQLLTEVMPVPQQQSAPAIATRKEIRRGSLRLLP
jgi:Zn-dependent peptidase ImmA (M78 family)